MRHLEGQLEEKNQELQRVCILRSIPLKHQFMGLYSTYKKWMPYRTEFWTLWEKARVGCFERTALKHVYYLGWNRSPAQVGCMRQVLGPGTLGRPRWIGWCGWWEGGSGWGTHVKTWLIHVNVWQKPLQYCKVISFQLIKINEKENTHRKRNECLSLLWIIFKIIWICPVH